MTASLHFWLDKLADIVNPALAVWLVVLAVMRARRGQLASAGAFAGRSLLALGLCWLVSHPEKWLRGVWPRTDFDLSGHTAFFVAIAASLCWLSRPSLRITLPLFVIYAALMIVLGFHTLLEIAVTLPMVVLLAWACHAMGRRRPAVIQ